MGPACVGFTTGPPGSLIPPYVGQYDLFEALESKLGHTNLIMNFLLMQWNMEVQPTSNYSLTWCYRTIVELGHADLIRDLLLKV